jgi:guanosine-3',5'-bis(diphosphate) 3'-pyrophosphohydrolase
MRDDDPGKRSAPQGAGAPADLLLLTAALQFAATKHRDQRRKGEEASPYINHPIALMHVLVHEGGVDDVAVLCAALLHDTIEDTETTRDEIAAHFGAEIAAMVVEVTSDMTRPKAERKQHQVERAPHLSRGAKLVKLADKICNLRDIIAFPPAQWTNERKQEYFDWARRVVDGMRGVNAALEAVFDAVHAQRP